MQANGYNLGPQRSISQVQFIGERISTLALKRHVRKDAVRLCDCIVTLPRSFDDSREREFFKTAYTFLSQRYGVDNVVSAYVHKNSSRPHMHFAWVPVTKDGRLSAKNVVTRLELKTLHPDMQRFMEAYESDPVDPKALKIKGVGAQQVVEVTGTSTCSKAVPDCIPPKAGRSTLTVKLHRP